MVAEITNVPKSSLVHHAQRRICQETKSMPGESSVVNRHCMQKTCSFVPWAVSPRVKRTTCVYFTIKKKGKREGGDW